MSLEYFNGGCGENICPKTEPHVHPRCDECGAMDYSGACLTCITLRGVVVKSMAMEWEDEEKAAPAGGPNETKATGGL